MRDDMMVETTKLELIATAIQQQAALLRQSGRAAQANGMERRANELRALSGITAAPHQEFCKKAA